MKPILFLCLLFLVGCADDPIVDPNKGTLTDIRDNHIYNWVKFGQQVWMAENLAYLPAIYLGSDGHVNEPRYYVYGYMGTSLSEAMATANYTNYGVLYNWAAAKSICPSGWHLPTDDEWKVLEKYLGMSSSVLDTVYVRSSGSVGGKLKEAGFTHWLSPNIGATNSSGFTALPGGDRYMNPEPKTGTSRWNNFLNLGEHTTFWSSSNFNDRNNWTRDLSGVNDGISRYYFSHPNGFSVRCLKDDN